MNPALKARLAAFSMVNDASQGRPLAELLKTKEMLKGVESQRLRDFCTSECMEPWRDLDEYGKMLIMGDLTLVKFDYELRVADKMEKAQGSSEPITFEKAKAVVAQDIYAMRWGPTAVPIYNLLGLFSLILKSARSSYVTIAKFFIETAEVPVDGGDMSGTTALSHCFSTKPAFDLEYAQMLYDASGDVNNRNRYGGTVVNEIVQIWEYENPKVVSRAMDAFEWFLKHGGCVDIADSDGIIVRNLVVKMKQRMAPGLAIILAREDKKRKAKGDACCALCGRDVGKLLACGRCKKARYCDPKTRACQKLDWPRHKKECKA